jgi:sugar lactone lactonase YvrE
MHRTTHSLRGRLAAIAGLGSLLALLAASPPAHAITSLTVDNHSPPVTVLTGENVVIRFDVAQPGASVWITIALDLDGTGKFDPAAPISSGGPFSDNGGLDADPAPGKIAYLQTLTPANTAGRYVVNVADDSDGRSLGLPLRIAPRPEAQAISGRVAVISDANPAGAVPQDAVIWAYRDLQTPVASASIQADGRYTLPVPPGSYVVFAEWFGNRRSQRQSVTLAAGQQRGGIDLSLLRGQEVSGRLLDGSAPMADALVQVTAGDGKQLTTWTFADGSYVFILPSGQYTLSARGMAAAVTVADAPVDGVDFPEPLPAADLAAGMIRTVAGNGMPGFGGDGRRATAARLSLAVIGIEVDAAGNLYIADWDANRVRKVDAKTGLITTLAGSGAFDTIRGLSPKGSTAGFSGDGGPATAAQLSSPASVAVDAAGNVYIADFMNHRVRKVDPTGIITAVAGSGPAPVEGGFAGDGGPATAARLNGPVDLALDRAGNLYICELNNARVRKVDRAGIITTVAGGGTEPFREGARATAIALNTTLGVAVDAAGNLFVADPGLSRILKVSPAGIVTTVAGNSTVGFSGDGGSATAAQINLPAEPAVDSAGDLYFTDGANNRIRKVGTDGIITTVAGSGAAGFGNGDFAGDGGPATAARLNQPFGIAIDQAGNLFIADQGNVRIRQVFGIAAPGLF